MFLCVSFISVVSVQRLRAAQCDGFLALYKLINYYCKLLLLGKGKVDWSGGGGRGAAKRSAVEEGAEPVPISDADFPTLKAAAQMARGIKPGGHTQCVCVAVEYLYVSVLCVFTCLHICMRVCIHTCVWLVMKNQF